MRPRCAGNEAAAPIRNDSRSSLVTQPRPRIHGAGAPSSASGRNAALMSDNIEGVSDAVAAPQWGDLKRDAEALPGVPLRTRLNALPLGEAFTACR